MALAKTVRSEAREEAETWRWPSASLTMRLV